MRITRYERIQARLKELEFLSMWVSVRHILMRSLLSNPYLRSEGCRGGKNVVFIHVPKTGGTSLANSLDVQYGHIPISRYFSWDPDLFSNSIKIAIVRNPWDRLASGFDYLHSAIGLNRSPDVRWAETYLAKYQDFEAFVHDMSNPSVAKIIMRYKHFRPQLDWIRVPGRKVHDIDILGRFENLSSDVENIFTALGIKGKLVHIRKPLKSSNRRFTEPMINIIAGLYEEDISVLGYSGSAPYEKDPLV